MSKIAEPLWKLYETPCPKVATVLGKGPSLESYTPADGLGTYVVGLNDVSLAVSCDAAVFADDDFRTVKFPEGVVLIRHQRHYKHHGGRGYAFTLRALAGWADGVGAWSRKSHDSAVPLFGYGSLTIAVSLLGHWGVRQIRFWGCDSLWPDGDVNCTAKRLAHLNPKDVTPEKYKERARETIQALEHYKIEWNNKEVLCDR